MKPSAEQVSALAKSEHDQLRDEIRALTEQNKLLENELVTVSAERDAASDAMARMVECADRLQYLDRYGNWVVDRKQWDEAQENR